MTSRLSGLKNGWMMVLLESQGANKMGVGWDAADIRMENVFTLKYAEFEIPPNTLKD